MEEIFFIPVHPEGILIHMPIFILCVLLHYFLEGHYRGTRKEFKPKLSLEKILNHLLALMFFSLSFYSMAILKIIEQLKADYDFLVFLYFLVATITSGHYMLKALNRHY